MGKEKGITAGLLEWIATSEGLAGRIDELQHAAYIPAIPGDIQLVGRDIGIYSVIGVYLIVI
jgi:hypothetical protein